MVEGDVHIRRAVTTDAQLLSVLSSVTFFDTFHGTCTNEDIQGFIETSFNLQEVYKELQDTDDFYFIAFINGEAAGYIRLKEDESDVAEIKKHRGIELKRIYVSKEYQSQKIGAKLMTFALDFASAKDYEVLWLGVWEHNEKAKAFYKKFGFEDTGAKHPFPIGNTPQTDNWLFRFIKQE
ncbi:MAG: GNAT family N-acetyltransferase [Ginsengibacter sp.]